MTMKTTAADELRFKIDEKRYDYFTFPVLDITIKYRKPDLLKLSLNNSLPAALSAVILDGYKEAMGGTDMEEYQAKLQDRKVSIDDKLITDLSTKGYVLLSELSVSHKFMDVDTSDVDAQPIPLIAFKDVPEEDAIAFLLGLMNKAQMAKTSSGGEVSQADMATFPIGKQVSERSPARARRKAVR